MGKKKTKNEKPATDLRNQPFKALKGIALRQRPGSSPAPPARTSSEDPSSAEEQFLRAVRGVKRISGKTDRADPARAVRSAAPQDEEKEDFLAAMRSMGTSMFHDSERESDTQAAAHVRSPSRRMRQLKRGVIRIGQELDLHGYLKDEALQRLEQFVRASCDRGLEAVLGTNSPDGPVLQGAVSRWLGGPGARYAAEFYPAPRERGGSGAYVVFLRRR
jgi:DNA-nicking Smr family endonuclease